MKNLLITLVLSLVAALPAHAQEPTDYKLYFPVVTRMATDCKETWRIIQPDGTTNLVLNPSAEMTGNYAAVGGAVVTRSTTYSHYGLYSYRLETGGGEGVSLTTSALANAAHFVTMRVRGDLPDAWRWTIGTGTRVPQLIEAIDADWDLYGAPFTAAECNGQTALSITQVGAGSGDFYVDGVQVEASTYWTTYCDGTQDGCAWLGSEHASASERSAQSRAGGRVRDLWSDFSFFVEEVVGVGAAPVTVSTRSYAILPGGELSGSKTTERYFTLIGRFIGTSEADLHAKRQELLEELAIDTYPEKQAVRVRFSGATVQKQISAYYTGGLEAQLKVSYGPWQVESDDAWRNLDHWTEKVAIQFLAPDPLWYEIGESAVELDSWDSFSARYILGRLRDTGQWDNLGPPAAATVMNAVDAVVIGVDGTIFVAGDFTGFNGVAGRDYIASYDPVTETWATVGAGGAVNARIRAMIVGPDGSIYVGGDFTIAGGSAGDNLMYWDGTSWNQVAATASGGSVRCLAFGLDGTLYFGGTFVNWDGDANADRIAEWNGTTYEPLGTGADGTVQDLAVGPDGSLYAVGSFSTMDGDTVNQVARWDGSDWYDLDGGVDTGTTQFAVAVAGNSTVYVGGDLTEIGDTNINYIAEWNGTNWTGLGSGVNNAIYDIVIGPDGMLYAGGLFTSAGGITLANRIAKWNGSSWAHLDISTIGNNVNAIAVGNADPVISVNYDVYFVFQGIASPPFSGLVTVENPATNSLFPRIIINRSGGTSAILEQIRNETTGKELLFDYGLLDGETLTIDLTPTSKSITSSFFGDRLSAILANSDFGTWNLQPDDNDVTAFIDVAGGPTIEAYMLWKDAYRSLD